MTTIATDIRREVLKNEAAVQELVPIFNESTGATWLWAGLFGPLYFLVHGMWLNILVSIVVSIVAMMVAALTFSGLAMVIIPGIVMWIVDACLAYNTWKERAIRKATNMAIIHG